MFPPSWIHLLPHPTPLGCHRSLALGSLCHISNYHWLSILHTVRYMSQCYSLISSHPFHPPLCPKCLCLLCPNIQIIGVPEEDKKKGHEKIFKEIIVKNFPKMGKETAIQVQEAQSPIQYKSKKKYAKTLINQTNKNWTQRINSKSSKEEATRIFKMPSPRLGISKESDMAELIRRKSKLLELIQLGEMAQSGQFLARLRKAWGGQNSKWLNSEPV